MSGADALLLGRKTWQIHGGAFEAMAGDPFADALNAVRKYVVTSTLASASAWRNSSLIRDKVVEAVRDLKRAQGGNILVDGSSMLVPLLARHGLVDEFRLHVYPVVLGNGKRIFPRDERLDLELMESASLPTGVVYLRYRSAVAN
jgi:dihydrofolate reductase